MAKITGIFMDAALIEGVGNALFITCRTDELRDYPGFCSVPFSGCSVKFSEPSVDVQWAPVLLQCTFSGGPVTGKRGGRNAPIRVFFGTLSDRWHLENQAMTLYDRRWELMGP